MTIKIEQAEHRVAECTSLLKNSFVELYGEEKQQKRLFYDAYSRHFGSETGYFAFFKTHQFTFSTGWHN